MAKAKRNIKAKAPEAVEGDGAIPAPAVGNRTRPTVDMGAPIDDSGCLCGWPAPPDGAGTYYPTIVMPGGTKGWAAV